MPIATLSILIAAGFALGRGELLSKRLRASRLVRLYVLPRACDAFEQSPTSPGQRVLGGGRQSAGRGLFVEPTLQAQRGEGGVLDRIFGAIKQHQAAFGGIGRQRRVVCFGKRGKGGEAKLSQSTQGA